MNKAEARARILSCGIVPVVRVSSAAIALAAAEAVRAGGVPIVEITLTVPGALGAIAELARRGDGILVGAGTVCDAEAARRSVEAGAVFLVSPGVDLATIAYAAEAGVLMIAGALTPTEVITAHGAGADLIKIFPCGPVGGPGYLRALMGPLPDIDMIPTGGVSLANAAAFLAAGAAALGVGSELVDEKTLASGDTSAITRRAENLAEIVRQFRRNIPHGP